MMLKKGSLMMKTNKVTWEQIDEIERLFYKRDDRKSTKSFIDEIDKEWRFDND